MAEDNCRQIEESGAPEVDRKLDRSRRCRARDQRTFLKIKDKFEEGRLPSPPPDPQCPPLARDRAPTSRSAGGRTEEEEEEDLAAYLGELGASPFENRSFDYDTPNSATSAMGGAAGPPFAEEAFEHLDRLCALTAQILELRDRSSKFFRRVRGLERAKALRSADRRLETALANDEELLGDLPDEDTGFAESLLDAMLSNCRDPSAQRRSERAPSSRQRSRSFALAEQTPPGGSSVVDRAEAEKRIARNASRNGGGPKVSKWTRVKAAFKWERACANDLAEIAESGAVASPTPTTRYLRIPDVTAGSWSGSALSPCTSEISSPSTPIGRVSPASSSNEEAFDDTRKNIVNYPDRHSPHAKDDRKRDDPDRCSRSFDIPVTENVDSAESSVEWQANRGKPLIRIISDADATTRVASGGGKDPEVSPKRPTPTLTITIPPNEEEIRSLSSPESTSPLPSSAQDSGGSSPQRPKATTRQDISSPREFKRQYSTIEEAVTPAPKIQRQDSKWNKVRRAFLTNATFSVPPSPVRAIAAQSFANDGTNHSRAEALRDYQALREKFGAEFHRKLVEWERLKSGSPRAVAAARNTRDALPLNEERLAPEFRKKLQDWKRAKKSRRTGASVEQQRVNRRRLTDWQLWRSPSKPEPRCYGKNQSSIGSRGSCASIGSAGSFGSDGKQRLCEDFVKRMEAWRRMSEAACRGNDRLKAPADRVAPNIIDETEFLALEKLLSLFGQRAKKERQESDAKQLNDCFDGDSRLTAASRGVNCGSEVLIRTSVGSYRFEGISREFTRKLYDWEKYRGISPRSSTFRLLGPGYTPFAQDSDEATLAEPSSTTGKNRAFHWSLKRSKSDGSVFEGSLRDESYTLRRSTSLQSLISTDKLEDDTRMGTLPVSNNTQSIKDPLEDTAVEDSEPEAMIVDIEDVIEETASPLKRVQPHQTPVYSVAASETTSIAVPLGTVTSSHEPSPVFLVEAEDNDERERWKNGRAWIGPETRSSENSPSPERSPVSEDWREGTTSLGVGDEDKSSWSPWCKGCDKEGEASTGWLEKTRCSISDGDTVKFDRPIGRNRDDAWDDESGEIFQGYADEARRDSVRLELPLTPIYESDAGKDDDTKEENFPESDDAGSAEDSGTSSTSRRNAEELTDSPRTCRWMNGTGEIADEQNNEVRKTEDERNDERDEDRQDDEDDGESGEKTGSADRLARTLLSSDRSDSRETSPNLSNLKLDDNGGTPECRDIDIEKEAHYENSNFSELRTDVDRHYEILTFRTHACDDATIDGHLYEPIDCHENRNAENCRGIAQESPSVSKSLEVAKPSLLESPPTRLFNDSTIRTIPMTVTGNSEARRLEKILINEETLNKIIVRTASVESATKRDAEGPRDRFANPDGSCPDEVVDDRRRDCDRAGATGAAADRQAACVKRDGSSSSSSSSSPRNVFVKTKRMIFGPFRRSEDRPSSSRKESDGSVDGRLGRSKSKSKSRSTSPKLCRQDALLRMSLSLPWPLRSISKESEVASEIESRRSSTGKMEDAVTVREDGGVTVRGRNSPCSELVSDERRSADGKKLNEQLTNDERSSAEANQSHHADAKSMTASVITSSPIGTASSEVSERPGVRSRATSIERDRSAYEVRDGIDRRTKDEEVQNEAKGGQREAEDKLNDKKRCPRRNEEKRDDARFERKNETRQRNHSTNDTVPSDLMHKLRILSDAAAKREGRATVTAEVSAAGGSESRSSRIRRAKESFLSRRGGPFCRSTIESTPAANREDETRGDPWRRTLTRHLSTTVEAPKSSEVATDVTSTMTSKSERMRDAGIQVETTTTTTTTTISSPEEAVSSSSEDKVDARQEDRTIDVGLRADLVKSASAGMINVDPDTFGRLVAVDRGCESLPRTIAKRRDSSGPLAKIVSKLKLSRLIRAKNADGGNMSTISTLCRQSLLIDTHGNPEDRRRKVREGGTNRAEAAADGNKSDDDRSVDSSETVHE